MGNTIEYQRVRSLPPGNHAFIPPKDYGIFANENECEEFLTDAQYRLTRLDTKMDKMLLQKQLASEDLHRDFKKQMHDLKPIYITSCFTSSRSKGLFLRLSLDLEDGSSAILDFQTQDINS